MRVIVSAIIGAILGFVLPIALCVAAAMLAGGPGGTRRSPADAILAIGPVLALVGLFVGGLLGIAHARKHARNRASVTNLQLSRLRGRVRCQFCVLWIGGTVGLLVGYFAAASYPAS
jgi:hypothetical protein